MGAFEKEAIQLSFGGVTESAFIIQRQTYFEKFCICVQYTIKHLYSKDQIYVSLATVCGSEYISSKKFEMSKSEISFLDILGNLALAVIGSL